MNSFILPNVNATLRDRLTQRGVRFYSWSNEDIVVEEDQFEMALQAMGAQTRGEQVVEFENMIRVALEYPTGENQTLPAETKLAAPPATQTSYRVRLKEQSIKRLQHAGVFFHELDGYVILDNNNLNIALATLNAIVHTQSQTQYENMVEITIDRISQRRRQAQASASAASPSGGDPARLQSREAYVKACAARMKNSIDLVSSGLNARQQKLPLLKSKFFSLCRQQYLMSVDEDEHQNKLREEYARIKQVGKIQEVRVSSGVILLYTDMLYAIEPETESQHEIGKFIIIVRTDGQGEPIRWLNQTRKVNAIRPSMNSPYVLTDGTPCVSEIQETFLQLIAQFDFAVVAELAIQFIETVNDDEAGKHIDKWPASNF